MIKFIAWYINLNKNKKQYVVVVYDSVMIFTIRFMKKMT